MNVCFNGCSFTEGAGFEVKDRDTYIYDRLVANHFGWNRTNIGSIGSSNTTIFMRSARAIMSNKYNIVLNQWTGLNRQWFYPGPDCAYSIYDDSSNFEYRDLFFDAKFNTMFKNTVRLMNHDYPKIIELIDYTNILNTLGKVNNTKVYHINGLVPWQDDLIKEINHSDLENSLSSYTKEIIDFNQRDDNEISALVLKLQDYFKNIDTTKWINLFKSFDSQRIDRGPLGHHPGPESHKIMAEHIINFMENQ